MKIVISSGHSKYCRGASCDEPWGLDEVDEATKVVDAVADLLATAGVHVEKFHDLVSHSQNENLNRIVNFHNSETRDYDVSVHFNAYETTGAAMGVECLYCTQEELAGKIADEISKVSGLKNRGPKYRDDLFFLNKTTAKSVLIEVAFVDSSCDASLYRESFTAICVAIAESIGNVEIGYDEIPVEPPVTGAPPSTGDVSGFRAKGKASSFGGPDDTGVSSSEGLAFIFSVEDRPELFLPFQPEGTTGLARRLNPYVHYVACRWDYAVTPKTMLKQGVAIVKAPKTGITLKAFPADWGPNENTGRIADLSPSLMEDLGLKTDDQVEVTFPQPT